MKNNLHLTSQEIFILDTMIAHGEQYLTSKVFGLKRLIKNELIKITSKEFEDYNITFKGVWFLYLSKTYNNYDKL